MLEFQPLSQQGSEEAQDHHQRPEGGGVGSSQDDGQCGLRGTPSAGETDHPEARMGLERAIELGLSGEMLATAKETLEKL